MRKNTKRNWSKYNESLVKRGDLYLGIDEETLSNWYSAPDRYKQGRPYTYSDVAIQRHWGLALVVQLTWQVVETGSVKRRLIAVIRVCAWNILTHANALTARQIIKSLMVSFTEHR